MRSDRWFTLVCRLSAVGSAVVVVLVGWFLVKESIPAIRQIGMLRFLSDSSWHPLSEEFNLVPMIVATLVTSFGAVVIAAPLGIASAIFCNFYAPRWLSFWHRRMVELLAGIPSVVFGLWGLVVLAPLIAHWGGSGQNLLTATIMLSLMVLPTVAVLSDSSIGSVPRHWIRGAAALGLERWAIIRAVVLPAARRGIVASVILALTRALGETMAVLMVAGNVVQLPSSLLSPGRTLNANIALELGYATEAHRSVLFVSGLILMLAVSAIVVVVSRRGSLSYG